MLLYCEPLVKRYMCPWILNVDRCSQALEHLFLGSLYVELMNPGWLILRTLSYLVMSRSDESAICAYGIDAFIDVVMYM